MAGVVFISAVLAVAVDVQGSTTCPAPEDVARRLGELLSGAADGAVQPDRARLKEEDDLLRITLERPDGTLIGERTLERSFPCADLAAAAALVLAAWHSDIHPEFHPPAPKPPSAVVARGPPPVPPPVVPPSRPVKFGELDLAVALFGTIAPSNARANGAVGILIAGAWMPAGGRLGVRGALLGTSERAIPLGDGTATWQRLAASAGGQLRLTGADAAATLDLHASVLGAWLLLAGNGFSSNHAASAFELGLGTGARLSLRRAAVAPWLELGAIGWPTQQVVYQRPNGASASLPRWEALLALGVSYGGR